MRTKTENLCDQQIVEMVEKSFDHLEEDWVQQYKHAMSPEQFVDQFARLQIRLPRQMGTTAAMVRLLNKYPNSYAFMSRGAEMFGITRGDFRYYDEHGPYEHDNREYLEQRMVSYEWSSQFQKEMISQRPDAEPFDLIFFHGMDRMDNRQHIHKLYALLIDRAKLFIELE